MNITVVGESEYSAKLIGGEVRPMSRISSLGGYNYRVLHGGDIQFEDAPEA